MPFVLDSVVTMIRERGGLRTPGLALAFNMSEAEIDRALWPLCAPGGPLISCLVEVDGKRVKEYRASIIGGGKAKEIAYSGTPRATPVQSQPFGAPKGITQALNARFTPPSRQTPVSQPAVKPAPAKTPRKEIEHTMTTASKILNALEKHGPMSTAQLREHVNYPYLSTVASQLARKGKIKKLGGADRGAIYGLEGQKAPDGAPAAPKRTAGAKPVRKTTAKALQGVIAFELSEERWRALVADAIRGCAFQLTVEETRDLAFAAIKQGDRA